VANRRKNWADVILGANVELIVGWRPRPDHLDAGSVVLSKEVAASLRKLAVTTLAQLSKLKRRAYGGAPYIEPGEQYLAVPTASLAAPTAAVAGTTPDSEETALLSELHRLVSIQAATSLSNEALRDGHYLFYAVICENDERVGFVRQIDPHKVAKAGVMALFGAEGLRELTEPLFVFDAGFDLVVAPDETAVLRLEAFNRLFADLGILARTAPANARKICAKVGNVDPSAVRALGVAAASSRSLARRLQRILQPGALPPVTPKALKDAMTNHGLDPKTIVQHSRISFTTADAATFVDLIEQIYFETDFTREHRRADRYSPL
jgi:hypothetical protein